MTWRRWPALVALLVVVRVAVCVSALQAPARYLAPDSEGYLGLAASLATGAGFVQAPRGHPEPETGRTPGYPLLVMLVRLLAGPDEVPALLFLQAVLVLLPGLALASLLRRAGAGEPALLLLWVVLCLDPLSLGLSAVVLSECTFLVLGGCRLALLARCAQEPRPARDLLCGAISGWMALVRPIGAYLWIADAGTLLLAGGRVRARQVATIVLGFAVVVSPWILRNSRSGVLGLSSMGGRQLLNWNAAIVEASARGVPLPVVRDEFKARYAGAAGPAGEALRVFARHPVATLRVSLLSLVAFVVDPGYPTLFKPLGIAGTGLLSGRLVAVDLASAATLLLVAASAVWVLALWWLAGRALLLLWPVNRGLFWACLVSVGYFALFSLHINLPEGARFRSPLVPVFALLVGLCAQERRAGRVSAS